MNGPEPALTADGAVRKSAGGIPGASARSRHTISYSSSFTPSTAASNAARVARLMVYPFSSPTKVPSGSYRRRSPAMTSAVPAGAPGSLGSPDSVSRDPPPGAPGSPDPVSGDPPPGVPGFPDPVSGDPPPGASRMRTWQTNPVRQPVREPQALPAEREIGGAVLGSGLHPRRAHDLEAAVEQERVDVEAVRPQRLREGHLAERLPGRDQTRSRVRNDGPRSMPTPALAR